MFTGDQQIFYCVCLHLSIFTELPYNFSKSLSNAVFQKKHWVEFGPTTFALLRHLMASKSINLQCDSNGSSF